MALPAEQRESDGARNGGDGASGIPLWCRIINLPNVLTALFLIAGGLLVARHDMWRDEAQAFLIARDSGSLWELFVNVRYEGHPPLWHILLWILTRVTIAPAAMQWFHLLLAATSVYLVARFAPFPAIAKVLFAFGYYPLFEYGVIARNYQLFLLLSVAVCVVWRRGAGTGRRAFVWIAVLIGLLSWSHVLGFILASAFLGVILLESVATREGRAAVRATPWRFLGAMAGLACAMYLSVKLMKPPPDGNFSPGWSFDLWGPHVRNTLTTLWRAYVPVSEWKLEFWGSNYLWDNRLQFDRGVGMAIAALLMLILSWRGALFFVCATAGLLTFAHVKYFGGPRHYGALYVALISAYWIAWSGYRPHAMRWWKRGLWLLPRVGLVALLAAQVYGAYVAVAWSWSHPFSRGREAAAALLKLKHPDDILFSEVMETAAPLAAYMPGEKFYFPKLGGAMGTFAIWKQADEKWGSFEGAAWLAEREKRPVILIRNKPAYGNRPWRLRSLRATLLAGFDSGIVSDEGYYFYRIAPKVEESASAPATRSGG